MIWALIFLLLALSFLYSGMEAGVLCVNRVRLEHHVRMGDRAAIKLHRLLRSPERALSSILLITNLLNIAALVLLARQLTALLGPAGYFAAFAVALPVYLLLVELLPKSLFRRFPFRLLTLCAGALDFSARLLTPITALIGLLTGPSLRRLAAGSGAALFHSRDHFKMLAEESERHGEISADERKLLGGVLDFRQLKARHLMEPAARIPTVRPDTPVDEVLALATKHGLHALPVINGADEPVGILSVLDLAMAEPPPRRLSSLLRRIPAVTAGDSAYTVLRALRSSRLPLAAVLNPKGKVVGFVRWSHLAQLLLRGLND